MASPMSKDEIGDEIILYQQAMESSYNEKAREMRDWVDWERKKRIKAESKAVNEICDKNELETLFLDCIEEVRKQVMKRRLWNEVKGKKSFKPLSTEEEA